MMQWSLDFDCKLVWDGFENFILIFKEVQSFSQNDILSINFASDSFTIKFTITNLYKMASNWSKSFFPISVSTVWTCRHTKATCSWKTNSSRRLRDRRALPASTSCQAPPATTKCLFRFFQTFSISDKQNMKRGSLRVWRTMRIERHSKGEEKDCAPRRREKTTTPLCFTFVDQHAGIADS